MTTVSFDPRVDIDTGASPSSPSADAIRIVAADLSDAQSRYRRLKADRPSSLVLVDIDVHISTDARTARHDVLAAGPDARSGGMQYVGTASGLAGLVTDIVTAGVADGVTVRPLIAEFGDAVTRQIHREVVPALSLRGSRAS